VKQPARRHQIVYRLLAGLGAVLLFGMYRPDLRAEMILWRTPIALAWAAVAGVVAGLLFTWWARIHLGRLWSSSVSRKADHHVVDTGPYGIVRHPIYTGIILASVATAAMRGTALAWLGACVMTVGWVIKARLEGVPAISSGPRRMGVCRRVPMLAARRTKPAPLNQAIRHE
jgi:protein-S-isoprenylcysteine O-methyltransferase Ste14